MRSVFGCFFFLGCWWLFLQTCKSFKCHHVLRLSLRSDNTTPRLKIKKKKKKRTKKEQKENKKRTKNRKNEEM